MDASVAVKWVVPEIGSDLSDALLGRDDLLAPDFLIIEVANALRKKEAAGHVTFDQVERGLSFISETVPLRASSAALVGRALRMAIDMAHPIYDCVYLAMAEGVGGMLVTHDAELLKRARRHNLGHLVSVLPLSSSGR